MIARIVRTALCLGVVCGFGFRGAAATISDAQDDFSLATNPNGVWTYGTTGTTLTGALTPFAGTDTMVGGIADLSTWHGTESQFGDFFPFVGKYTGASTASSADIVLEPGQLAMHPAPSGAFAVTRFTAPAAGMYSVNAIFEGREVTTRGRGTHVDVHVLHNGVSLFAANVNGFGPSSDQSYAGLVTLALGDTLDFSAGIGSDNTFLGDTLSLSATVSAVPEAGATALAAIGASGSLSLLGRKRRKVR